MLPESSLAGLVSLLGKTPTRAAFFGMANRRTKRWEAHIWADKKQVYLGGFADEACAGAAHDVMAIKCRGKRALSLQLPMLSHVRLSSSCYDSCCGC